ncbi:MAG TPA: dihydrolipoamide acetyltransferase family protein [Gaiellaceae bacterium]|nr:dihydrolipoamide acetyltransferase family protein [Gaiellaceae bacterium]
MKEITMPSLSDSMEEGTILGWLKADGEYVAKGEELFDIETDKATMTYHSEEEGVLAIVATEGTTVAVGTVIARLAAPGTAQPAAERPTVVENPDGLGSATTSVTEAPARSAGVGGRTAAPVVRATPVARRLAAEHEVDLRAVVGSGPGGRVLLSDVAARADIELASVEAASASAGVPPRPMPTPVTSTELKADITVQELTRLQQVVARRMVEAKSTIPDFQVQTEASMDAAIALREQLKALGGGAVPSLNDIVVKACALALREYPRANGSYRDGRFELHARVNVGIAVAAEDALLVPTITDADTRSLGSIAAEARRLAERARSSAITPAELSGATFTVSNLGMYGMTAITPVINPPQAAILGVGATRTFPAVVDGRLVERHLMTLTLSCDHRILYGADAAQFLARIRQLLEQPVALTL